MSRSDSAPKGKKLVAAIGAVVFASDEPVPPREIATALGVEVKAVESAIAALEKEFEESGTGLRIEWVAGGPRLSTRSEVGEWVRRFVRHRNQRRLSLAALETLAIVAYRQPMTAPEIQAIRGKDPTAALKGLVDKKLIRIDGRKKVVGNPLLYATTRDFLVHFGLNELNDLPSIEEFDQFLEVLESLPDDGSAPVVDGLTKGQPVVVSAEGDPRSKDTPAPAAPGSSAPPE